MKIKKIDIQTTNKSHALEIAMLVDRQDFLLEIESLREKWHVSRLTQLTLLPEIQQLLNIQEIISPNAKNHEEQEEKLNEFNLDVEKILKKFGRGKNFKVVVIYSALVGIVPANIFSSCYFDVATVNEAEDKSKPEKYQYIIVLSPRTEQKELKEAFSEFQNHIKNKIAFENRIQSGSDDQRKFLNEDEDREFHELSSTLEKAYQGYMVETKNKPLKEALKERTKFIEATEELRNRYAVLKAKTPINMNDPQDADLIEAYLLGGIYNSALIDDGNRRDLDRTREWYWMRFGDFFNGLAKLPKTYEDVAEDWCNKCPKYGSDVYDDDHKKDCPYCHVDASNIAHALSPHEKLLG